MGGAIGGLWLVIQAYYNKINHEDDNEEETTICEENIEDVCKSIDILMISMLILVVIFIVSILFIVSWNK